MPRTRAKPKPGQEVKELRVTLDAPLASLVVATMKEKGFGSETEYVRHMVRTWLSHHGLLPPLGLEEGKRTC